MHIHTKKISRTSPIDWAYSIPVLDFADFDLGHPEITYINPKKLSNFSVRPNKFRPKIFSRIYHALKI